MKPSNRNAAEKLRRAIKKPVQKFGTMLSVLIHSASKALDHKIDPQKVLDKYKAKFQGDRDQWRRWYQVNRRRQRQQRALKQLCGVRIDPRTTTLPRFLVR